VSVLKVWNGSEWAEASAGGDHGLLSGLGDDDHSQYTYNAPASETRNDIQATDKSYPGLTILFPSGGSSGTADYLIECLDGSDRIFGAAHSTVLGSDSFVYVGGELRIRDTPSGSQGHLHLYELGSNGDAYVEFIAAASMAGNYTIRWPNAQGGIDQVLVNDGSGNLSWGSTLPDSSATPSAPASGSAFFYDTDDDEVYFYDAGRGHWMSVTTYVMRFGRSAAISDGENLRSEYAQVTVTGSKGVVPGFDMTVVGMNARTNGAFTGSFDLYDGGTDSGEGLTFTASSQEDDYEINYDITSGRAIGCRVSISSGSPTNPGIEIHYRKRK
jgi:hypothetical protein